MAFAAFWFSFGIVAAVVVLRVLAARAEFRTQVQVQSVHLNGVDAGTPDATITYQTPSAMKIRGISDVSASVRISDDALKNIRERRGKGRVSFDLTAGGSCKSYFLSPSDEASQAIEIGPPLNFSWSVSAAEQPGDCELTFHTRVMERRYVKPLRFSVTDAGITKDHIIAVVVAIIGALGVILAGVIAALGTILTSRKL
jgi:hypothetical protein